MNLLLKSVKIISEGSPLDGLTKDIYIENGIYKKTSDELKAGDCAKGTVVFDAGGAFMSPGWFDMCCRFTEPGHEQKETIESGQRAAAAGGFTGVVMMPSTSPPVSDRSSIEYIISRSKGKVTTVYPAGCLTTNSEGKEMAGMYDMKLGGAVAFSDDKKFIKDAGLMLRLLQYSGNIQAPVLVYADEISLSGEGQANESFTTSLLGFKGAPSVAEELAVARDIMLAEYSGVSIHISGISSRRAVERIREAKKKGIKVTAETAAHYLVLTDNLIEGFDTNYKVKPPLRTEDDAAALREGVADGTIDVIVSDHTPEDAESKQVEWDFAAHGISALETMFAVLYKALRPLMSLEQIIKTITVNPRNILRIPVPVIEEGAKAEFTLFDPSVQWTFNAEHSHSLSRNTPFHGYAFTGRPVAVFNNNLFEPQKW